MKKTHSRLRRYASTAGDVIAAPFMLVAGVAIVIGAFAWMCIAPERPAGVSEKRVNRETE